MNQIEETMGVSGSIDDFLDSERSGGALEKEGSFSINLREAARKMAVFGQSDRTLWTLKFGQAFQRLGCRILELSVTSDAWYLDGLESKRDLDFQRLKESLSKLGLEGDRSAESLLALGISALSVPAEDGTALEAVCWVQGDHIEHILGEVEHVPATLKGKALILQFPKGLTPPLPQSAWENAFSYSTMDIYCWLSHKRVLINNTFCTQFMAPGTELLWLEYLGAGETHQDLTLTPTGRALACVGENVDWAKQNNTSRLRWKGSAPRERSIVILARDELAGPTEIYPVVAGCVLEPFTDHDLCDGFKIVVTADDCPTDLGHNQLRRSPQSEALADSCKPALRQALDLMQSTTNKKKGPTVVSKPTTPVVADAAPSCLGCLGMMAVPVLMTEPIVGTLIAAFFGGPSGFYFWYSRRQRGKEFEDLKSGARGIIEQRKKDLE